MMWAKIIGVAVGTIVLMASTAGLNRARLRRAHAALADRLLAQSEPQAAEAFCPEMVAGLPAPVQLYLTKVIREGQPTVTTVRLRQTGEFRLGDRTSPWKSFSAAQTFTTTPPGFVWDATIVIAPLMSATVIDRYQDGAGAFEAKMLATFTVASAAGEPELNSGELMRYLAEAVWFPTALLPSRGVSWTPLDTHSAQATIEHNGTRATLTFFFGDDGLVTRVYAPGRAREVNGHYEPTPWTGTLRSYQWHHGLYIPTEGEVAWNLPDGDLTYWRARIDTIDYEVTQ